MSAGVLAVSLAACTSNPTPLDRPGDVPEAFTAPADKTAPLWPKSDWWTNFTAEELGPLEETAQKENLDIAVYAARVLQAEAQDGIALSGLFPTLGLQGSGQRSGGNSTRATTGLSSRNSTFNTFNFGLSASYQQNVFGQEFDNL
ncbi:MAG TPA: TolC family protein, partial [Rhizomicrobium sp.]